MLLRHFTLTAFALFEQMQRQTRHRFRKDFHTRIYRRGLQGTEFVHLHSAVAVAVKVHVYTAYKVLHFLARLIASFTLWCIPTASEYSHSYLRFEIIKPPLRTVCLILLLFY